jgi:alkylation response protein AidB-like acyl-CoA dehydrogenase
MSGVEFQEEFSASAKDLMSRLDNESRNRKNATHGNDTDRKVWKQLADAGWFSVLIPQEDGGLGLGLSEMAAIAAEAGKSLLPEPYIATAVQLVSLLNVCPPSDIKTELLNHVMEGDLIGGVAWQEQLGQTDPGIPAMRIRRDGSEVELNGTKCFVVPSTNTDGWVVNGCSEAGESYLLWVPSDVVGMTCKTYRGVDGSSVADLQFNHVRVSGRNVLAISHNVSEMITQACDYTRIIVSADLLGVIDKAFEITLSYVKLRKQFGKPVGSFQALKHKIVDCYVHSEIARATLEDNLATSLNDSSLKINASRVKARLSHAALFVTRSSIQFHGAIGFTDEYNIGLYLKRATFLSAWLGNASVHRDRYLSCLLEGVSTDAQEREVEIPSDEDFNSMSEEEFRAMLRTFFRRNYPEDMRNIQRRLYWDEVKSWTETLSKRGWLAPGWPREFGGLGLSAEKLIAYVEEYEGYGVARTLDMGPVMVGPLLIKHGTAAQRERFLPKILSAEHRWCQGYSEPGAGSDLAALSTQAVVEGDCFVVNGQKIWTTLAHNATHMFTLVRTDKTTKKQAGISFLLIELSTPGITIRPIRDIGGQVEFCEVFLQDVRVPLDNLVGDLNQGWAMAKALLGFERIFLGSPKQGRYALSQLKSLADKKGLFADNMFRAQYAEMHLQVDDQASCYAKYADLVKRGEPIPPSISLLKIWGTETYQGICLALNEWAQELSALNEAYFDELPNLQPPAILYNAIPSTIYGGSSQIQREIIARNVLEIPGE